uniref:PPM-type phosphatase domain-containing protein n=1 Tax=Steinernema glaseri TaxID=37863 RepID=A0A1I7YPX4_9BILA
MRYFPQKASYSLLHQMLCYMNLSHEQEFIDVFDGHGGLSRHTAQVVVLTGYQVSVNATTVVGLSFYSTLTRTSLTFWSRVKLIYSSSQVEILESKGQIRKRTKRIPEKKDKTRKVYCWALTANNSGAHIGTQRVVRLLSQSVQMFLQDPSMIISRTLYSTILKS